jgi:polysaccharide chain length determinant protein (PEP-CTERM system associated)
MKDQQMAMQVTNTIVNLFIEENLSLKREEAFASVDFIQEQKEIYKKKLEESEDALRLFKLAHIGEMPGEQNVNLVQLERLRDSLAETNMGIQEAIGRKRFIERQLSGESQMIVSMRSGDVATIDEKIMILELQLSQLLSTYTDKHPDIVRIRAEIENLKKGTGMLPTGASTGPLPQSGDLTTLNPLYQGLKEDYNNINITIGTLQTKKSVLENKIGEFEQKVLSIPNQEKQLISLQRDYNVNERIYNMLLMKFEEARISKHLEFSQGGTRFQVIEPAIVPITPVKPNRLHFLLAALLIGCVSGAGLIYLKEYFDTSTRGVKEAEEVYNLAVLATIPVITTETEVNIIRRNRWRWLLGSALFLLSLIGVIAYAMFRGFIGAA